MLGARILPLVLFSVFAGCDVGGTSVPVDLSDDADAYISSSVYRRGILERDLTERNNRYAQRRLTHYGLPTAAWADLPIRDPVSAPLTSADTEVLQGDGVIRVEAGTTLSPLQPPTTPAAWIELGRRVFFEYPLRADRTHETAAGLPGALETGGFLVDEGAWVGLRKFIDESGDVRIGTTCSQCHASYDETGTLTGVLSNREMDLGALRLLTLGFEPGNLPDEVESSTVGDLARLGPGRSDLLSDGVFNPYAFPDLGGIADLPYLHQNANWYHEGTATLAVRCETLFITANGERSVPPKALTWALASYLRSLPPPPPVDGPGPLSALGEQVFAAAGCGDCHTPPLFTSDRLVALDEVGTDPGAGESVVRWTGHYRIPSLRGVGRAAPYLHHGAFPTLEAMFDPERDEPGHAFGLELGLDDRTALVAYLRTL